MQKKNFKTILLSPPLSREQQAGSLKSIANILPTLGIGYIAAYLEKNNIDSDVDIEIVDCIGDNLTLEEVIEILKEKKPQVLGITATILTINISKEISRELKKYFGLDIFIVIGGPQVSSAPEKTMQDRCFDMGVIGEGEVTFFEIIQNLKQSKYDFKSINGVIFFERDNLIKTADRVLIDNLDKLPMLARHLYPPLNNYSPVPSSYRKKPVALMVSSRGCPYQCVFCDRKVFGNRFRAHSAKYVVDEIELLIHRHGAKEIRFMDDTFTLDKQRVYDICDEIKKRKIKIGWSCFSRVNTIDFNLLKKMKNAGCWQILYGIESADQEILDRMKKGVTVGLNELAINLTKKAGISVRANFIFGMPGETRESIKKTLSFAKRMNLDVVNFFTVMLYPGNELYQIVKNEGKIIHEDYDHYSELIDSQKTKLHYVPEGLTEIELKNAVVDAYKSYYMRTSVIIKTLFSIRNFEDVIRFASAALSVLSMKKS